MTAIWTTRAETSQDRTDIRSVTEAAFPTPAEAGIVDALRADPTAWVPGLSHVCEDESGQVTGHAVLSRCTVPRRWCSVRAPLLLPLSAKAPEQP